MEIGKDHINQLPKLTNCMKHYLVSLSFLLSVMTFICNCQGMSRQTDFFASGENAQIHEEEMPVIPNDSLLLHGVLSDGTHYIVRTNKQSDTTIIERAERSPEQVLIVVGDVNPVLAIDGLEAIVQTPDSLGRIPPYTATNIYRFGGKGSRNNGRIDLCFPVVPEIDSNMRKTTYTIAHATVINLIVLMVNNRFSTLKKQGRMPKSIGNASAYLTFDLDGGDKECLCLRIDSRKEMERQARDDAKRCLEMFMREGFGEGELNNARDVFRRMVQNFYFNPKAHNKTFSQLLSKRIADAFVQGNEVYDYQAEGELMISMASCFDISQVNEIYKHTVLGK